MRNLAMFINDEYVPFKALIIYKNEKQQDFYVESYDMDHNHSLINRHPLSTDESNSFALAMDGAESSKQNFLVSRGLLPKNILHINSKRDGFVVWFTPAMEVELFFRNDLGIKDGLAKVPPMIWKAKKDELYVYSLSKNTIPNIDTPLCYAPFFNIYDDGKVCMGSVDIKFDSDVSIEDFMLRWRSFFFNSKFSHVIRSIPSVTTNMVELWQNQIDTDQSFPLKTLKKCPQTLKHLIQ